MAFFSDFGFYEIMIVAALIFVCYRLYDQTKKFTVELAIVAGAALYLLYTGIMSPSADFGLNP